MFNEEGPKSVAHEAGGSTGLTLAVVVPAHNEAVHIADVLSSIPSWVDGIIVIDDASTDDTSAVVASCSDQRIRLVRHDTNTGVGGAMRTGYQLAVSEGFDLVCKMDADGQMRGDELSRLVEPLILGIADYTKGNRFYFRDSARTMPLHRGFGNTALSFMTKLASGYWHVFDSQCGFTVIRTGFLNLLELTDLPDDYFFENDMLIKLQSLGARVVDVPISTIYGKEVSGLRIGRVVRTFPLRLATRGARRFWRRHLVTDFGAVGSLTLSAIVLLLWGVFFGAYHWWLSVSTGQVATTGTVMIAVLPLLFSGQLGSQAFVMSALSSPGATETAAYIRSLISRGEFANVSRPPDAG